MIEIYSFPATRGVRITWACEELSLPYNFNVVDLYKGEHKKPEYLAISPTGKVPVIKDGDLTLAESGAIVTYLADKCKKLIPQTGTSERGLFDQAMYFVLTELEQPLWTMAKHKFVYPEDKRIQAALDLGLAEFHAALNIFSQLLGEQNYIAGDEFTVADIIAGHTLSWAQGFKIEFPQKNVNEYAQRVLSRKALAQARAKEKAIKESLA